METENAHGEITKSIMSKKFVPITLTNEHLQDKHVQAMLAFVENKVLDKWELGYKGKYLCSCYMTESGLEDFLHCLSPKDDNFRGLVMAHYHRFVEWGMQYYGPPRE